MKIIKGIGIANAQKQSAAKQMQDIFEIKNAKAIAELTADNKRKDAMIAELFKTINKINIELQEIKGE